MRLRDFIFGVIVPREAIIKDADQVASKQRAEVRLRSGHNCSLDQDA